MTPGKNGLADKFGMTTLWGRERSLIQKWEEPLISGLQENREKGELIRIWEGPTSKISLTLEHRRTTGQSGPRTLGPALSFKIGKDL